MQNFAKARQFFIVYALSVPLKYLSLFSLLLISITTDAQNVPLINSPLNGIVLDSKTKQPLPGVLVKIESVTNQTQTNSKGRFDLITGQKFPYNIIISHIGYETRTIRIESSPVTIFLNESFNELDNVVVVGYATQKKTDVVGAVTKIDISDVNKIPVASFDAQLQGKAAGVQINSNSGVPGDGIFIRVRGTTSINAGSNPLYIVDGVFINNTSLQSLNSGGPSTSPIADINPSDIESIDVLKDASATAIYGARGANGVIIVTTKRGNFNAAPKVQLNLSYGRAEPSRLWEMASGQENAEIYNVNWINSGIDNPALNRTFANRPFRPVSEGGRGLPEEQQTYDRLTPGYRTAQLKNVDLSVQGGASGSKYYIGVNYTGQEATLRPVDFSRAGLKFNFDQKLSESVSIGTSNILSKSYRNQARSGDGGTGNPVLNAMNLARYLPFKNPDGTPATYTNYDDQQVLLNNLDQNTDSWRYIGNLFFEVNIIPGLKFKSSWSLDYNHYDEFIYWNSKLVNGAAPTNGKATAANTINTAWINEQILSYNKNFDSGFNFGALIGNTLQSNISKYAAVNGEGFPNDAFTLISSAATTYGTNDWTKGNIASFFSRADLNYAKKYYIEASLRADGASNFGKNNQWGYFPAVGISWRAIEEKFLNDISWLSDFKVRASSGLTGNQSGINNFAARGLWGGNAPYLGAGISPLQLANTDLRWEKTWQTNVGLDIGLWQGRVNATIDLYSKNTKDVLLELPVQAISGFTSYYSNAGEINNKGLELAINTINIQNDNFKWQSSFNVSFSKNHIKSLPAPVNVYSRDWIRMEEGHPMYSFWLYKQLYVDPQTGNAVYDDVNNDGKITVEDRQLMGTAIPTYFGGLSNSFTYKNVDLNFLFTFQGGNKSYTLNRFFGTNGGTRPDRVLYASEAKYWKKEGDITDVPRPSSVGDSYGIEQNSRLLADASFIRLKTLTVGYSLGNELSKKIGFSSIRVYAQGTNLFMITKYPGADPEGNVSDEQNVQGLDWGASPQPRAIQFGINASF